jgi:hypothetical protein
MAVTFRAIGTAGAGGNTAASVNPGVPAGTASGDILIVCCLSGSTQAYTGVTDNAAGGSNSYALIADNVQNGDLTTAWYWTRVGNVPTTITATRGGGGGQMLAVVYGFYGCVASGTPYEDQTLGSTAGAPTSSTTPTGLAVTATGNGRLPVCFASVDDDPDYSSGNPPSGWSDMGGVSATSGTDARIDAIYRDTVLDSGNSTADVTVGTLPAADFWQTLTLLLIPPAGEEIQESGTTTSTATQSGTEVLVAVESGTTTATVAQAGTEVVAEARPINLLRNPGLESGSTSPWIDPSSANIFIESTTKRTGSYSLRSEWVATDTNMGRQDVTLPGASRYTVSAWVYIPSSWSGTGAPYCSIELADTFTLVAYQNPVNAVRDTWQFMWRTYDIGGTDFAVTAVVRSASTIAGHVAGQSLYFDDLSVEQVSSLTSQTGGEAVAQSGTTTTVALQTGVEQTVEEIAEAGTTTSVATQTGVEAVGATGTTTSVARQAPERLVTNPDFESGTTGWIDPAGYDIVASTEQVHSGTSSLKSTYVSGTDSNAAWQAITVPAAGRYYAEAWIYIPASWSGDYQFGPWINFELFTGGTSVATGTANEAVRDSWQRVTRVYDIAAGDLVGSIVLRTGAGTLNTSPDVADFVYFDDVVVLVLLDPLEALAESQTTSTTATQTGIEVLVEAGTNTAVATHTADEVATGEVSEAGTTTTVASQAGTEALAEAGTNTSAASQTGLEAAEAVEAATTTTVATQSGLEALAEDLANATVASQTGVEAYGGDVATQTTATQTGVEVLSEQATSTTVASQSGLDVPTEAVSAVAVSSQTAVEVIAEAATTTAVATHTADEETTSDAIESKTTTTVAVHTAAEAPAETGTSTTVASQTGADAPAEDLANSTVASQTGGVEALVEAGTNTTASTQTGDEVTVLGEVGSTTTVASQSITDEKLADELANVALATQTGLEVLVDPPATSTAVAVQTGADALADSGTTTSIAVEDGAEAVAESLTAASVATQTGTETFAEAQTTSTSATQTGVETITESGGTLTVASHTADENIAGEGQETGTTLSISTQTGVAVFVEAGGSVTTAAQTAAETLTEEALNTSVASQTGIETLAVTETGSTASVAVQDSLEALAQTGTTTTDGTHVAVEVIAESATTATTATQTGVEVSGGDVFEAQTATTVATQDGLEALAETTASTSTSSQLGEEALSETALTVTTSLHVYDAALIEAAATVTTALQIGYDYLVLTETGVTVTVALQDITDEEAAVVLVRHPTGRIYEQTRRAFLHDETPDGALSPTDPKLAEGDDTLTPQGQTRPVMPTGRIR